MLTQQPHGLILIHWKQSQKVETMALKWVIKTDTKLNRVKSRDANHVAYTMQIYALLPVRDFWVHKIHLEVLLPR